MRSPELVVPDRLEHLLRGGAPEGEREAALEGLLRELRTSAPAAPERVRERARRAASPSLVRRRARPRARAALALAAVLVVAAAVAGAASVAREGSVGGDDSSESAGAGARESGDALVPSETPQMERQQADSSDEALFAPTAKQVLPADERAREVDMSIALRLRDAERLSEAANEAMAVANDLGGFVVSSSVETEGAEGTARLSLRVPVNRVEDAVVRLSGIGTITAQDVTIEDLQGGIDRAARRIEALRGQVRIIELRLESGTLDREEELRLQIRLERVRRLLAQARGARARLAREAAMADLALTLHTREAAARADDDGGRVAAAAGRALDFLAGAGSVAVFLLVAGGPLLLAGLLVGLALRARTRRLEARLLDESRPAARSHAPPA